MIDLGGALERLMRMDDRVWARHANPWSLYTRIPIFPLMILTIYARTWLGWWALLPGVALIVWTYLNPRAFPRPERFDTWAAKGTFGERIWLARKTTPIPEHHRDAAFLLTVPQAVGLPLALYGAIALEPFAALAGTILVVGAKLWFVDRMVWLYEEAGDASFTKPS